MEVHFTPETEKKLKDLSTQSGRRTDDLVEDAMAGYLDEVLQAREMLNSRYDDLKSGRVKPISRDQVIAHFREKSAARRSQHLREDSIGI
jgi:predicted DNA-binding protein